MTKRNSNFYVLLLLFFCFSLTSNVWAQNTIQGTIVDETGEPLIGANVVVKGTAEGTTTDYDGTFSFDTDRTYPIIVEVSYTGYTTQEISVASGSRLNVTLVEGILAEEVVVSASRKREKVQEAPASISVISARKLETSAQATDPVRNLQSTAGVQIQQQSANRINISMRGGAGLFGTSVFPILDYRSLVGPGIGTFQTDQSGLSNIDLQRIEVVRGPGSALYGPGVTQGVVHFISKSPIDVPGTTVELFAGELATFGGAVRHATKVNDKFGFKINAQYRQGKEFVLDPNNPDDALQIAKFLPNGGIFQPAVDETLGVVDPTGTPTLLLAGTDLDADGDGNPMSDEWDNHSINTTLEFRPQDNLNVTLSGGYNSARSVFYNEQGEGFADNREFWGQARMQAGGLFAQVFAVNNDGGTMDNPTFLYQTGFRTPVGRTQVEGQVQYNFQTASFLDADWTIGADYRFAGQDTERLVYGRNEEDDSYSVVGGYIQGKFALMDKLDLVLAGRYDRFNFIDEGSFAPRAAIVYKANPKHTFRASYNKASSTVSNLQLNIDFPLSVIIPGQFDVWLRGNKEVQAFPDNPTISWALPALFPDSPLDADGLSLATPFVLVNSNVSAGIVGFLESDPSLAPLAPIVGAVLNGLDPTALGTTGSLSPGFNIFDGTPLTPIDAPISTISTDDTWELGYKGLIADKLGVTFDIYRVTQRNNSQFTAISPAYILSGYDALPADLGRSVFAQAGPQIEAALIQAGFDAVTAAGTVAALQPLIEGGYTQGGDFALNTPSDDLGGLSLAQLLGALPFHATTQTTGSPVNGATHLAAGYRTFDERTFTGFDLGLEYYFTNDFSGFFNYSWVDNIEFMQNVVGNEAAGLLPSYLNIPKNKFRLGVNYTPTSGIRGSLSFQHDDSYFSASGQFSGDTDVRNLVDASVGYRFDSGLAIDLSATNLLNNEYRYLPNMPMIGRRALAKLVYTFGGGE